jgi:antitoxin (DNA-binding transcriptional repressor) of toxin-antitoxin stability system
MKTISTTELLKRSKALLREVSKGAAFVVTYRGKAVARLMPLATGSGPLDDPIYQITDLASPALEPLANAEIDRILYAKP